MKKNIIIISVISLIFLSTFSAKASKVLASSFGYNATNSTSAFQNAVLSNNDTIIVDIQSSEWNVGPNTFNSLSNKTIIFEPGVIFKALPGLFNSTSASLLRFNYCSNITLIGYGATLKMNRAEYAQLNDSEHRMNIRLWESSNITIKGFIIDESGGDGIYVGGEPNGYCENIFVEDVQCINHYRQGMSIANVQNMTVRNSYFANTQGTLPEAGIDVEPWLPNQRIVDLLIENCRFENNGWAGIAIALEYMDNTAPPVGIIVRDCVFKNNSRPDNKYRHCEIAINCASLNPVQGNVLFERCFIEESNYTAVYCTKPSDAFGVTFKDCAFQNVSKIAPSSGSRNNQPILFAMEKKTPAVYMGGVHFDDVLISYSTDYNFIHFYDYNKSALGVKNVTGNFTVVEPSGKMPLYTDINAKENVTYGYTNQNSLPPTKLSIFSSQNKAIECNSTPARYTVSRSSENTTYPLGVSLAVTGTVNFGDDVNLLPKGLIIPANTLYKTEVVSARNDMIQEADESLIINISGNNHTIDGNPAVEITVSDCSVLSGTSGKMNVEEITIFPNPVENFLYFKNANSNLDVRITDNTGKSVFSKQNVRKAVDLSHLLSGIYFLTIGNSDQVVKIIKK